METSCKLVALRTAAASITVDPWEGNPVETKRGTAPGGLAQFGDLWPPGPGRWSKTNRDKNLVF